MKVSGEKLRLGDVVEFANNGAHETTVGVVVMSRRSDHELSIQCQAYITGIGDRKYRVLYNVYSLGTREKSEWDTILAVSDIMNGCQPIKPLGAKARSYHRPTMQMVKDRVEQKRFEAMLLNEKKTTK